MLPAEWEDAEPSDLHGGNKTYDVFCSLERMLRWELCFRRDMKTKDLKRNVRFDLEDGKKLL